MFVILQECCFRKKKLHILYFQQWEVKAPMPSQAMRSAVKQITKLHESLSAVLPGAHVEASCSQNSNSLLLNYFT